MSNTGKEKEEEKLTEVSKTEEEEKETDKEVVTQEEKLNILADDAEKKQEDKSSLQQHIDGQILEDSTPASVNVVEEVEEQVPSVTPSAPPLTAQEQQDLSQLPDSVRILKEAFPDIDIEVIEAVLQVNNNQVENSFETLLGMSDPTFQSKNVVAPVEPAPPSMPPRPPTTETRQDEEKISVEEQMRLDEEFAKKLAMEDEMRSEQRRRQRREQQQQQQRRHQENDDDPIFNLQEELPIIKEKMKEAGNAAKKKVMDFYNQIKAANTRNNNNNNNNFQHNPHYESGHQGSSMPTTNAQYRGLPSDDGDDLLTDDISALHLSDYDVYAKTAGNGKQRKSLTDNKRGGTTDEGVIYVNPPLGSIGATTDTPLSKKQTSTSDAQLKADEDFARQLAQEEQLEARRQRSRQSSSNHDVVPDMPPRKAVPPTVVIAPRSPLEFEGDSDYEDIGLTAAAAVTTSKTTLGKEENTSTIPYVIGDDDDSDDDLVDIDEDELFNDADLEQGLKEIDEEPSMVENEAVNSSKKEKEETIKNESVVDDTENKTAAADTTAVTTTFTTN